MVLGCLPGAPLSNTKRYQGGMETMASGATGGAIEGGHALCGSTESRTLFLNVAVRDPRHNTDHYMVLVCLPGAPLAKTVF